MSVSYIINTNKVSSNALSIIKEANYEDLKELADFTEVLEISSLFFKGSTFKESNLIVVEGSLFAKIMQRCAISDNIIEVVLNIDVRKLFNTLVRKNKNKDKHIVIKMEDEDIEDLQTINIDLKDIIREELLLNINPFAKIEG